VVDVIEIYVYWYAGRSKSQVAASLGLDRKTVRKYLGLAEAAGISPGGPPMSEADWAKLTPVGETLHAQRVGQMDVCPGRLQGVGCPVPAVGGLQDHVGAASGLLDLQAECHRVVQDAHRTEPDAVLGLPHLHEPPAMQVDTNVLMSVARVLRRSVCLRSGRHRWSTSCFCHTGDRRGPCPAVTPARDLLTRSAYVSRLRQPSFSDDGM
jgi:hypothetical protein